MSVKYKQCKFHSILLLRPPTLLSLHNLIELVTRLCCHPSYKLISQTFLIFKNPRESQQNSCAYSDSTITRVILDLRVIPNFLCPHFYCCMLSAFYLILMKGRGCACELEESKTLALDVTLHICCIIFVSKVLC